MFEVLSKLTVLRSEIEEDREINHHGKPHTVKKADSGSVSGPMMTFDKNLISRKEQVQDQALKDYYKRIVITSDTKRKILAGCIMFSRKVKPIIATTFVVCYWSAGLHNYYRIEYDI